MKVPDGLIPRLVYRGFSPSEVLIVFAFMFYLTHSVIDKNRIVRISMEEAIEYSAVSKNVFYSALKKMIGLGMKRVRVNTYDLTDFIDNVKQLNDKVSLFKNE